MIDSNDGVEQAAALSGQEQCAVGLKGAKKAFKETPNKLLISRKWAAWGCRKARFSAADYWITKATPWLSALTGASLPQQAIIAGTPSTDSTGQTAWSVAPCSFSWQLLVYGVSHHRFHTKGGNCTRGGKPVTKNPVGTGPPAHSCHKAGRW